MGDFDGGEGGQVHHDRLRCFFFLFVPPVLGRRVLDYTGRGTWEETRISLGCPSIKQASGWARDSDGQAGCRMRRWCRVMTAANRIGQEGTEGEQKGGALKHESWSKVAVSILRVINLGGDEVLRGTSTEARVIQGLHNSVQVIWWDSITVSP